MTYRAGNRGFTLLELSIVLIIIAIITGMSVQMGVSVIASARQSATQQKMSAIEQSLKAFRAASDRLPCPADLAIAPGAANFGVEGATPGTCTGGTPAANHSAAGATNTSKTGAEGAVPVVTLGLPADFMFDGWGNRFRYAVDISMTSLGAFAAKDIGCTDGPITVKDANGNARSSSAMYALISHGANGHGAYTTRGVTTSSGSTSADELTNCHCTSAGTYNSAYGPTYVQKLPAYDTGQTGVAAYYYDDLVTYKERWQMQTAWDKTGGCVVIYVADSGGNRVEVFTTSGAYVSQIGCASGACSPSSANGQFNQPGDIGIDSSGNIWVADNGNSRVEKFNSSGTYLGQLGCASGACATGSGNGQFGASPGNPQVDSSGNIWVLDYQNKRVQEFGSNLAYKSQFSVSYEPNELGLNVSTGTFYITNQGGYYVAEYNSSGTYLTQFGSYGTGNGQFESPNNVIVDSGGNIWVSDYSPGNRIEKFNSSATYVTQMGCTSGSCSGTGNGQFNGPNDIAIDSSGNIWVADGNNNRVEEFNSSGTFLLGIGAGYNGVSGSIGSSGSGNGQFNGPIGIAISSR